MATIPLKGKYAVGKHSFALVDDDMLVELSKYAWKAKPNGCGTHIYAVRNIKHEGMLVTVRMHRVVVGYYGGLDVDHINRDPLDNRRANLRVVTRSQNVLNSARCLNAQGPYSLWPRRARKRSPKKRKPKVKQIIVRQCEHCGTDYIAVNSCQMFCSESCKKKVRWLRKKLISVDDALVFS
jgi:hypothetical protein